MSKSLIFFLKNLYLIASLQEDKNFQLQARLALKDEEIEKLQAEKNICIEKQEVAEKERAQAKQDKMEVIFMYETRIKGMKRKMPQPKETAEIAIQTESDESENSGKFEDQAADESVENGDQRTMSAGARLQMSSFQMVHIIPEKRPKTADNSILKERMTFLVDKKLSKKFFQRF